MRRNTKDSLDNAHEQALTEKEKKVTNVSFSYSSGQSCRNTFQTNKAVIYSRGKAHGLQQLPHALN